MAWDEVKSRIPEEGHLCKKMCGKCCVSGAPVEKSEVEEILAWLSDNVPTATLAEQFRHADTQPAACPFLKPDKGCFVYPARPLACRMFGHAAFEDSKNVPDQIRQKCPEGISFTQVPTKTVLSIMGPWSEAAKRAHIRIGDLRKAITFAPQVAGVDKVGIVT